MPHLTGKSRESNCPITYQQIVLILRGKYAGKKAVVISVHDKTKEIPFQHALLAGILKAPRRINKSMPKKKIDKRIRIKPFTKVVNLNHLLPTRCV